jgi:hypothetical protein
MVSASGRDRVGWGDVVSEFLRIALIVAAVGYVLVSRFRGQQVKLRRTAMMPLVLAVIGGVDVARAVPHLTSVDLAYLVVSGLVVLALGALRGTSVHLYERNGFLWLRYRPTSLAWWVAAIAARIGLMVAASAMGVTAGLSTSSILLAAGLNLCGEAAVVVLRGMSSGVPFAADDRSRALS